MKRINWLDHLINFLSVIVGVTLAFLITSWSENAKKQGEAKLILSSIFEEVKEDRETYEDYQIPHNEEVILAIDSMIRILSQRENLDRIDPVFTNSIDINNYFPANITFKSVLTSGKLDLIGDFELRKDLAQFDMDAEEAKLRGLLQVEFLMDKIVPWSLENDMSIIFEEDPRQGKMTNQLVTLFSIYQSIVQNKLKKYEELLEESKRLEKTLEKSLKE